MDPMPARSSAPVEQTDGAHAPRPQLEQKKKIDWAYQVQQYGAALLVAIAAFAALSIYLMYRRGYYNLYIANKVFAGVSVVLLGVLLLLGPVSRYFDAFDKYLQYRKELGVVAMFLAVVHAAISYFFLPTYFPREWFIKSVWPFLFGLAATIILVALFVISREAVKQALGVKRWWRMQYWGVRIAFALIALHVGILKMPSWISWYQKGGGKELVHPEWPGAGLLVGWFIAFVIIVRLAELGGKKFGTAVWYLSVISLPAAYLLTFLWGQRFIK